MVVFAIIHSKNILSRRSEDEDGWRENVIILIDAYNMLKQIIIRREIAQQERTRFLSLISRYSNKKKHHMVVVFDGGPYEWLHRERVHGVQVVYSGLHQTADDYIKHYIGDHKESDLLLVSDDRDLNLYAQRFSMPSISPRDFYILVQEALRTPVSDRLQTEQIATKISDESHADIDVLMQEASRTVPTKRGDTPDITHSGLADGRKLSKEERKLLQKLKKL
jgi:predicted RNA-binding protein with PIN domain